MSSETVTVSSFCQCGCNRRVGTYVGTSTKRGTIKGQPCRFLPGHSIRILVKPEDRFWPFVDKAPGFGPKGECWRWTGSRDKNGYGLFYIQGNKQVLAHRYAYFLEHGEYPIPCGLHECDTPTCMRPSHIWAGTIRDNNRDRDMKGRAAKGLRSGHYTQPHRTPRGESHISAHFSDEDVRMIRRAWANQEATQVEIARRLGTAPSNVSHCINYRTYKHVT